MDDAAIRMAREQAGLISWRQLHTIGVTRAEARAQLRARRWQRLSGEVLSTTTGPLSREQRLWLGVLHAGGDAMLAGLTAARVHGLRNWDRDTITVAVANPHSFEPIEGFRFFRSRRPPQLLRADGLLPVCKIEPAVLMFAAYERNRRTAHGAITACVQQRLTTPAVLAGWLDLLKPLRRAVEFRALISDLDGGVQSLAERDVRRACLEFGVAEPTRQRKRRDRSGRVRYTDCEWKLPDGRILVLEVDGAFHDDFLQAMDDRARARKLTDDRTIVISCSAYEIRYHPASVMEDLIALGVPRRSRVR